MAHTPSGQNEKRLDEDETKHVDEIRELVRIFLRNHTRLEKPKYDVVFHDLTVRGAGIGVSETLFNFHTFSLNI